MAEILYKIVIGLAILSVVLFYFSMVSNLYVLFFIGLIIVPMWVVLLFTAMTLDGRRYKNNVYENDNTTQETSAQDILRNKYEEKLKAYYEINQPRIHLINEYCEARLMTEDEKVSYFYVKERCHDDIEGRYFEIRRDLAHISTMWAIFDMEFNNSTTYESLRDLYTSLNDDYIYTYEKYQVRKLPFTIYGEKPMVQTEYCRLEQLTLDNGKQFIICSEIWGTKDWDKPRKFIIDIEKSQLTVRSILTIVEIRHKMCTFQQLLKFFENTDFYGKVLTKEEFEVYQRNITITNEEQNKDVIEENKETVIQKYNERNIDL